MKSVEVQLEQDVDWRLTELAMLKLQLAACTRGSVGESAALRAIWTMLYAHYEGFCKYALDVYLDHLQILAPTRSGVRTEIARFSLEKSFRVLRGNMKSVEIWQFFMDALPKELGEPLDFQIRLETNSNLYPGLLEANCAQIGLVIPSLQSHYGKLRTLVTRRNEIAHGQRNFVKDVDEYMKYETAVVEIMYELAYAVVASAEDRTWMLTIPA